MFRWLTPKVLRVRTLELKVQKIMEDITDLQSSEAARDAKDDAVIALVTQLQTTNAALQAEVSNLPADNSAAIQAIIDDNNAYITKLATTVGAPAAPPTTAGS